MNTHTPMPIALIALLTVALPAGADAPAPDFTNLPAYITALNRSTDPQAAVIRREIAGGPAALARARAAALAAGIPLTTPTPPVALGQNAAPLYQQWWDTLKQRKAGLPNYADTFRFGVVYTPAQLAQAQRFFADNRDAITALHQATETPQMVFPDPLDRHFAVLREAAREIGSESFLLAQQGRYAEAVTDQARGFGIAHQLTSQPSLINYLVADAVEAITLKGMQDTLAVAGPDAAVDAQVRQTVQAALPVLSLKQALTGEVPIGLAELDQAREGTPQDLAQLATQGTDAPRVTQQTFTLAERVFVVDLLDATEAAYLTQMRTLIAAADQPDRHAAFTAAAEASAGNGDPAAALDPLTGLLQILTPTYGPLDRVDNLRRADEQVTLAAAAVLATKAQTGAFPDALPGVFTDPFSSKSLGYRHEGDGGFVVYSVGPDGTFNGEVTAPEPVAVRHVFFRYPGPTPQPATADMLK